MSKFQIILLGIFGFFIIAGVFIFSTSRGSSTGTARLTMWGPVSSFALGPITQAPEFKTAGITLTYVEKPAATFVTDLTEALAEGRGPDMVIFTQDQLWQLHNKLALIPFSSVSLNDYSSSFIDEANLFATSNGLYALPLVVDPMVLYSNKDLLNNAGLAVPLKYWDQIYTYISSLTQKDAAGNITQSTIALGEARNIPHYKDILTLLMLQAGTPITAYQGGELHSQLLNRYNFPSVPSDSALDFYTQFANPAKPFYSWNRSLTDALTSFLSGDSAFYLGFASEEQSLRSKNPNLNIGVSAVPQSRVAAKSTTFATLYGIGIVKNSPGAASAMTAAGLLVSQTNNNALAKTLGLAPARRDLLASKPSDGVQALYYDAAIQAQGWIDPNPTKTKQAFADLIDAVTSGREQIGVALGDTDDTLDTLINAQ